MSLLGEITKSFPSRISTQVESICDDLVDLSQVEKIRLTPNTINYAILALNLQTLFNETPNINKYGIGISMGGTNIFKICHI